MGSLREKVLSAPRGEKIRAVEQWGGNVLLLGIKGKLRAAVQTDMIGIDPDKRAAAIIPHLPAILIAGLHDPATRTPLLSDDDADTLADNMDALREELAFEILELSGVGDEVENELGKDSPATENDNSTSE